jgi:hypothetical protein
MKVATIRNNQKAQQIVTSSGGSIQDFAGITQQKADAYALMKEQTRELKKAERFMSGFEDDNECNPGIALRLRLMRKIIDKAGTLINRGSQDGLKTKGKS